MSQLFPSRPVALPTTAMTETTKLTPLKRRIEDDAEATPAPAATGNESAGSQAAEHGPTPADESQGGGSPAGDAAANDATASSAAADHVATSAGVAGDTDTFSPAILAAVGLVGLGAAAAGGGGGGGRDGRVTSTPPVVQPPVVEPPVVHPPVIEPPVTQPPEPQKPAYPQQPDPKTPDGGQQGPNPSGGQTPDPTKTPVETPIQTPPDAPQLKLLHDTGASAEDKLTNDGTVQVDGIANGNGWKYSLDGGATWVSGSDDQHISGSHFSVDGEQHVLVSQVTPSGLAGAATELVFQLDTTAPAGLPVIRLVRDTGIPRIEGTLDDRRSRNGNLAVSGLDDALPWLYRIDGGAWQQGTDHKIPQTAIGADGQHAVQVKQVDVAGNEGAIASLDFILDRTVATPTVAFSHFQLDANGHMVTNGGDVTIEGLEQGGSIFHRLNSDTSSFLGVLDRRSGPSGTLIFDLSELQNPSGRLLLRQGENTLDVGTRDSAANWAYAKRITFIYDSIAPDAPKIALKHDDGTSSTDKVTSDPTLTIGGLESASTWKYSVDGGRTWTAGASKELARGVLDAGGDGDRSVRVIQTDFAGNDSAATLFTFTLDSHQSAVSGGAVI